MAKSIKKRLTGRSAGSTDSRRESGKVLGTEGKRNEGGKAQDSLFVGGSMHQFRTVPLGEGKAAKRRGSKVAKGAVAPGRLAKPFQHDVFASEAEYDQSVENVVARIRSGQVKARTPDE